MSEPPVRIEILARSARTHARRGRVHTPHGPFHTPAFMPVGTRGTVKGVLPELVAQTGAQIVLANTYHLMLRPGSDLVRRLGGLHAFMRWNGPILTDSGGYQAYSMADMNRVSDDGVRFKSIIDGAIVDLTPERAIEIQNDLGPDIIMALDDCPPSLLLAGDGPAPEEAPDQQTPQGDGSALNEFRLRSAAQRDNVRTRADHAQRLRVANERTVRWLERCRRAHRAGPRAGDQALFGIVQGGTDLDQRRWCAERICAIDLPGYAIGGVAVGERFEDIARVVRFTAPLLPQDKPRYLMGVGYERDLLAAVLAGVDMFDCVLPTRNGRNAQAFTPTGPLKLRNAVHADDPRPIVEGCDCVACAPARAGGPPDAPEGHFSRAYIRHLFIAEEMLGPMLVTLHNLRHVQRFMADVRETVASDAWEGLVARWPVAAPALAGASL